MSDKKYEKNHSAERRAPVDELPNRSGPKARKHAKLYKIESRWTLFDKNAPWRTHNRYRTAKARDEALRKLKRDRIKTYRQWNGHEHSWGHSIEYR